MTDKLYCMSSYLALRTIADHQKTFSDKIVPRFYDERFPRKPVYSDKELELELRAAVEQVTRGGKAALALSGGIDSAILAKFMPAGSVAYTFRCIVPGIEVTDESPIAAKYAQACGLEHRIVNIYWEDFLSYAPRLMKQKGMPVHSIEIQICKATEQARKDGFTYIIFGESADANYGGLNGLLSKDWHIGEFIDRYWYVKPYHALKKSIAVTSLFEPYVHNGLVDAHDVIREIFFPESLASYTNACDLAGIVFEAPYARTYMGRPLELERVRKGENKYWVREIFKRLYPGFVAPAKLPMPRATNEWLQGWEGPVRPEFWPHCTDNMTGDQKWLVYCLEWFLNLLDEGYLTDEKI